MITSPRKIIAAALFAILTGPAFALVVPSGGSFDVPAAGSVNLACTVLDDQGTFNLNSGQLDQASAVNIGPTGVLNGGSGILNVSGDWTNAGTFNAGTGSVVFQDGCSASPTTLSGDTTFYNLTLSSTSGRTFVLPAGSHITVLGSLTLQGAPGNPIQINSSGGPTAIVNLGPGATVSSNFANVAANVQIGAAPSPASIPTLNEYGLIALGLMLCLLAAKQFNVFQISRRNGRAD